MSIKQFSSFLFAGILSVFIISCQNDNKAATDKKNEVTENDSTKNVSKDTIHSKYNEIARLIAKLQLGAKIF